MSKEAKLIRGQLRQIFKEEAPNVLNEELATLIYKRLFQHVENRLEYISKNAQDALKKMEERQKDMQNMLLRQYSAPLNVQGTETEKKS